MIDDIPWFTNPPAHWSKTKFKFLLKQKPKNPNMSLPCGSISFGEVVYKSSEKISDETKSAYQEVLSGEMLINPLNLNYDLKSLRTALSSIDVVVSSGYIVLHIGEELNHNYARYLMHVFDTQHMKTLGAGIRQTITFSDIGNSGLYLPPLKEQELIGDFLHSKTLVIESLIKEKQNFITLLEQKRKALISEVVTKGLDSSVPMKDSGIDWIGEVPEHWEVKSYKYACKIYRGKFTHRPRNDPDFYDGLYPFIQTGDIAQSHGYITKYKQTLNERGISVSQAFPKGSLVMAIAANVGDTAILDFEAYAPDSVVSFKPVSGVALEYLKLSFDASIEQLKQTSVKSTFLNLNVDRIGALKSVFPPLAEQQEILRHINREAASIDDLVFETQKSISLLKEQKESLITAAVTGQIDVREYA